MQSDERRYELFGMTLASELALPLPASARPAEVRIRTGPVPTDGVLLFETDEPLTFACYRHGDAIVLAWDGVRMAVMPNRIVIDTEDLEMALHLLIPAAWSVLLASRGREALHGAAVALDGAAVAIMGESGSGKTTAARALIAHGWSLLTDDLLTFEPDLHLLPGPQWMRVLSSDAAAGALPDAGGKARILTPTCNEPMPLRAVIVLSPEYERCTRLTGMAAAAALLQNVYNPIITHPGQEERRFELVHDVASRVPVFGAAPRSLSADQLLHIGVETRQ